MTHQRPIPAANKTTYPRQFPPHAETHAEEGDTANADTSAMQDGDTIKGSWAGLSGKAALGAAAGIGSAALLAAFLYAGKRNGKSAH